MRRIGTAVIALLLVAATGWAHHGLATQFDMNPAAHKKITGNITKVLWRNPHIYFKLEVPQEDGDPVVYTIESVPVSFAREAGLTAERLMGGGQSVEVTVMPARKDPLGGFGIYFEYEDGFIVTFIGFME